MSELNELIAYVMDPVLFWELFWYGLAGVCSTIVSQVGYSICFRKWSLGNVRAKVISWFGAATTAFVMMRYLAFSETVTGFWQSAWKFYSTRIFTAVLTVLLMWLLMDKYLRWDLRDKERVRKEYRWWPEVINLGVTILEIIINYFIAKFFVF